MVIDPIFWLGLSFLLVSISLTAVLVVLLPAVRELGRAARSVEKLCDTLSRELPPTLESIRLTSLEITELTDDMTEGVQNAGRLAQQVDQSVSGVRQQAKRVHVGTRSFVVGVKAAWRSWTQPRNRDRRRLPKGQTTSLSSKETPLTTNSHTQSRFSHHDSVPSLPEEHSSPLPELPSGKATEVDFVASQSNALPNAEDPEPSD